MSAFIMWAESQLILASVDTEKQLVRDQEYGCSQSIVESKPFWTFWEVKDTIQWKSVCNVPHRWIKWGIKVLYNNLFRILPFLFSWPSEAQRVVVLSLFSKPLMEIVLVQMSFVDQGSKERVISSLFLIRYNYVFNSMYSLVEGCSC